MSKKKMSMNAYLIEYSKAPPTQIWEKMKKKMINKG